MKTTCERCAAHMKVAGWELIRAAGSAGIASGLSTRAVVMQWLAEYHQSGHSAGVAKNHSPAAREAAATKRLGPPEQDLTDTIHDAINRTDRKDPA